MAKAPLFPILERLRTHRGPEFKSDLIAGITTAVMLIPQGMAYALLAGLPPVVGLYASLLPALGYAAFGTSRTLSVGPVAMDSLLVAAAVGAICASGTNDYLVTAALLALLVGAIQVLLGTLRLGYVLNFLSQPVMTGFTSAAALLIAASQLKYFLGIPLRQSQLLQELITDVARHASEISLSAAGFALLSVGLLLGARRLRPKFPGPLALVVAATLLTYLGSKLAFRGLPVDIVGDVPSGLPRATLPVFDPVVIGKLLPSALVIAIVAFLEASSVAQTYAKKERSPLFPNRELIALGISNLLAGIFQGFPVTGGFSRTAVNANAGAKSTLAAIVTSAMIGLTLLLLTPALYFVPKVVLAAIVVVAVVGLIDLEGMKRLYRISRTELALFALTFVATLTLGILPGIGLGVATSLIWFVIRTTRPHVAVLGRLPGSLEFKNCARYSGLETFPGVLAVRLDAQFYFGNVRYFSELLGRLEAAAEAPVKAIILDASAMNNLDSSAEQALHELEADYERRGIRLYLAHVKGPVMDVLRRSGFADDLGKRIALTVNDAVQLALEEPGIRGANDGRSPHARSSPSGGNYFI